MTTRKDAGPLTKRPYFNFSGDELIKEFRDKKGDPDVLKTLLYEIEFRKKTYKISKLNTDIKAVLDDVIKGKRGSNSSTGDTPTQKKQETSSERKDRPQASNREIHPVDDRNGEPQGASKGSSNYEASSSQRPGGGYLDEDDLEPHARMGKIRRPGKLTDVPEKRVFKLKDNVKLAVPKNSPLAVLYESAVKALIDEMRKKGSVARQYILENGVRIHLDGHETGYQFPFDEDTELFEGATVIVLIGGSKAEGRIVALQGRQLVISVSNDFGPRLTSCVIKVDNTVMLEALRSRLEKVVKGEVPSFNTKLAESVIRNEGDELAPAHLPQGVGADLNIDQKDAISKMLSNNVFYLWGPPGTGKTQTLSALCLALFAGEKKVLLCSNTNQAVDQVLLKLCQELERDHPALIDGRVIRIGHVTHDELREEWSEYITIDGIMERKSESLIKKKNELEEKLGIINKRVERSREISKVFALVDGLTNEKKQLADAYTKAVREYISVSNQKEAVEGKLASLEKEKATYFSAGTLKRLVLRSLEGIERDLSKTKTELQSIPQKISSAKQTKHNHKQKLDEVSGIIDRHQQQLSGYDRKELERQIEGAEAEARPITEEIADINRQLENMRKAVLESARIVGATVTKAYLSPQLFTGYHIVIVDEASMVMLPALFNVAGLAKEKVLISGDYRQLAPIVPTDQKGIFDVIGGDIFQSAKVSSSKGHNPKRSIMLKEQYRMDEMICQLISSKMYEGDLITSTYRKNEKFPEPPQPFNNHLTIIDTSPIWPFVNRDPFGSRFNLMNALAVRNLCRFFVSQGYLRDVTTLGVSTPYAAQAKILKRILGTSEYQNLIGAGTVHRYQGDQKETMIIDIPDSYGEWRAGIFLDAEQPNDTGALLFNVAISRAKAHLIILANLAYLDKKLPSYAFLREILAIIQDKGTVLDVRDVLAMYPITEDLRRYGSPFDLSPEAERTGLFNSHDFDVVFQADMDRAKKGIVIFSGFVTPQRVASYEALFRRKVAEGVIVRCVTRPPSHNGSIPFEMGRDSLDALESMGCIVDTRGYIHQKIVIVDDEVVWVGSLNPLSHTARTDELMARVEGKPLALQIASFLAIEGGVKPDSAEGFAYQKENPPSPCCGARVAYMKGRWGPYWLCEKCGKKESAVKSKKSSNVTRSQAKDAPICDKCGSPMVLRSGRFGQFYGCSNYPRCKNTIKANNR